MQAALANFAKLQHNPKAVILGDMLELGEKSTELHATVIKQMEACNFDSVLLCGEHFSKAGRQYTCFPTVEKLNDYLETNPLQGYNILIKGSRGIRLEKTIDLL
jgi:UDP-N-acetylmuramoyl-tripeptide--D-alanyl-D-alanine ligase